MQISRPTARKYVNMVDEPLYERVQRSSPKLCDFADQLKQWLGEEAKLARPWRRSTPRLFEGVQEIGFGGAYDSVQRWKAHHHGPKLTEALVALLFVADDACLLN